MVIQQRLRKQINHTAASAGLRVFRAPDQACNPRVLDGTGAHRAGLQRHIQFATGQAIIADPQGCFAQCDDFGMRGWIVATDRLVAAACNHFAIEHHDRAHRHLAGRLGKYRLIEGALHEAPVKLKPLDCNRLIDGQRLCSWGTH